MVYSSWLSLFRWDGVSPTKVFVGLDNYGILLTQNDVFWIALKNNAIWLVAALLLPTSIGLGLAILLNSKFRGSHIFRSVFYFPSVLSLAVVGLIWTWIYHPDLGLLNQALSAIGLKGLDTQLAIGSEHCPLPGDHRRYLERRRPADAPLFGRPANHSGGVA